MSMDEMSFIVTTLERINNKLDKHDDKIDMIVQALQQLVKVDTENKENREALSRLFKRVETIEHNQNTEGCQAHKNFIKVRGEQLKSYDQIIEECEERYDKVDIRLTAIESKPTKRFEVMINEGLKWLVVFVIGAVALKFGVKL